MYAASFVLTLRRVETTMQRTLSLRTLRDERRVLALADRATAAIEDVGELSRVTLENVAIEGYEPAEGDAAVEEICSARFREGGDADLSEDSVATAREADRVERVDDEVVVPVGAGMPGVRNWWLLADLLVGWLDDIVEGFRRAHHRATMTGSATVETALWAVVEMLAELRETLERGCSIGRYLASSMRHGSASLIGSIERITSTLLGGDDA